MAVLYGAASWLKGFWKPKESAPRWRKQDDDFLRRFESTLEAPVEELGEQFTDPPLFRLRQNYGENAAWDWLEGGDWLQVNSSNVDKIRYSFRIRELTVRFLN